MIARRFRPIDDAARYGALAALDQLLPGDLTRLNAQDDDGRTPLMLAAYNRYDAVVARLLALGADGGLVDSQQRTAAHWACEGRHAPALALLLDAGASINMRNKWQDTPLIHAAAYNAVDCVELLLARGGPALELDAANDEGSTALHFAAGRSPQMVQLLLQAGADPTIRNRFGETPLDWPWCKNQTQSIALLEAALAEPQRARSLLKARALCNATSHPDARIPRYLQGRVMQGLPLPEVVIDAQDEDEELLGACVCFALGLEGHGGWAGAEDERATMRTEGLFREVFVELMEYLLLVPCWDRANV